MKFDRLYDEEVSDGDRPSGSVCELETARDTWNFVLGLIASGTPLEGIEAIGKSNVEAYEALLTKSHS